MNEYNFQNNVVKKKLPISLIEQIDKEFSESGITHKDHDGTTPHLFDAFDVKEARVAVGNIVGVKVPFEKRGFFTKRYEIYTHPDAKEWLAKGKIYNLVLSHSIYVILKFDYRISYGWIEFTGKEFTKLLEKFPILKCVVEEIDNTAKSEVK